MREVDKTSGKHITIIKKHSISEKTRGENSSPFSSRDAREDQSSFLSRGIKSLGKKYLQQNVFKAKEKEHHGVVISDELVRNSKQYRMLREKMDVMQGTFIAETNQLLQTKQHITQQINEIRGNNQATKLTLWELKNQILQLKAILNDEEEEGRRLEAELNPIQPELQELQEEAQQEMGEEPLLNEEDENEGQEEADIRLMMVQVHKKMRINPEQ